MAARLLEEAKLAEVTRMLGDIGHDIKNMLMPVLNGTWLLQDELNELFSSLSTKTVSNHAASQKLSTEIIEMIGRNARRIQDRVREIADAVKGVTSPPNFASCEIAKIVEEVYQTLRTYAGEKGISLNTSDIESLPIIEADERRLFNALYNLVNNAIPEVPSGGSVTIRGGGKTPKGMVELIVADTGRGMSSDIRDRLFTSRTVSTKNTGTGLGTKIVKDVIDLHQGHIRVESEPGKGTTFYIQLPMTQAEATHTSS
jgi:signal transduction histidine kinase